MSILPKSPAGRKSSASARPSRALRRDHADVAPPQRDPGPSIPPELAVDRSRLGTGPEPAVEPPHPIFPALTFRDRIHGRPATIRVLSAAEWAELPEAERDNWGRDEATGARLTITLD